MTTRIAFGYAADFAAQLTKDVYKYYYKLEDEEVLIDGTAAQDNTITSNEE